MPNTTTHNENSNLINNKKGEIGAKDRLTPEEAQQILQLKDERSGAVGVQVLNQEQVVSFSNGEKPAEFDVVLLSTERERDEAKSGEILKTVKAAAIKHPEGPTIVVHDGNETKTKTENEER